MPSHCLLAFRSYEEKSAVHFTEYSCAWQCFSLAGFKIVFFFQFWQFEYNMSLCECVCIYPAGSLFRFLNVYIYVFPQIWKFFPLFFRILFLLLSSSLFLLWLQYNVCVGIFDDISHVSQALLILLYSFFFLFLTLDNFNCLYLQGHWYFLLPSQMCCWIPLVSSSYIISISLLILLFFSCVILLIFFD